MTFETPPLSYLNDPKEFIRWHQEVGAEEAKRQLTEATREYMEEHGTRAVLDVTERMDDIVAFMSEWVDLPEEPEES